MFAPQASSLDKGHGRIEYRAWLCLPITPKILGYSATASELKNPCLILRGTTIAAQEP